MASKAPAFQPVTQSTLDAWAYRLNEAMVNADRALIRFIQRRVELKEHIANNPKVYKSEGVIRDKLNYDWEAVDAMDDYRHNHDLALRLAARIAAERDLRVLNGRGYVNPPS